MGKSKPTPAQPKPRRRVKAPSPSASAHDPTKDADFESRVERYVAASTVADEHAARASARTIVGAELHEEMLLRQLATTGQLTDDQHRVLSGTRSNLLRLRKALGVLEPKKKAATGFLFDGDD